MIIESLTDARNLLALCKNMCRHCESVEDIEQCTTCNIEKLHTKALKSCLDRKKNLSIKMNKEQKICNKLLG